MCLFSVPLCLAAVCSTTESQHLIRRHGCATGGLPHHCAVSRPVPPTARLFALGSLHRPLCLLRHLRLFPLQQFSFLIRLPARGSGLSFRIPSFLACLKKGIVKVPDACTSLSLTYLKSGNISCNLPLSKEVNRLKTTLAHTTVFYTSTMVELVCSDSNRGRLLQ